MREDAMGMFDDVVGKVLGMEGDTGDSRGLIKALLEMLSDQKEGGLSGLVQSFQQKGLGGLMNSWIGTGENAPISPEQVKEAVGSDRIRNLAARTGMSTEEVSAKLSEHLPGVIDKVTPSGVVPEAGLFSQGLDFVKSRLS
jgi:uncharacterized protein YidB (DUF937 family)